MIMPKSQRSLALLCFLTIFVYEQKIHKWSLDTYYSVVYNLGQPLMAAPRKPPPAWWLLGYLAQYQRHALLDSLAKAGRASDDIYLAARQAAERLPTVPCLYVLQRSIIHYRYFQHTLAGHELDVAELPSF